MIKRLLTYKPTDRCSAEEALKDPWIVENTALGKREQATQLKQPLMANMITNLSKLKIEQKLQQAVLSYLANFMGSATGDQERKKLQEIFKAFDSNGDGQLEYKEMLEGYIQYFNGDAKRAEVEAKTIFEKLDFNGNGTIDYSEFLIANLDPMMVVNEERLREVFNIFDIDNTGAITAENIKKLLGGKGNNNTGGEELGSPKPAGTAMGDSEE